jgi:hypothetical protein
MHRYYKFKRRLPGIFGYFRFKIEDFRLQNDEVLAGFNLEPTISIYSICNLISKILNRPPLSLWENDLGTM